MSGFKPYPAYKDSGVEWLGEVPEDWCHIPIKYMALERSSLFLDGDWIESKDISSDGIRYITTGNVGEGVYKEQGAGFISEETFYSLGCTEVCEGDVLISRLNNPIGRACVVPNLGDRVVTSVDNVIFRPDSKFYKKFIVYLFSSDEYFKHTGNLARGATMQRISRGLLGNIRVITPSLEEQTQIARFLDHETARIDALIEEQQRLIELLKEKRQAVISHAVTKGLDPTVPMKDSGVEWLGEVPEHWVVCSARRVIRAIEQGWSPECEASPADEDAWGILKAGCVNRGVFNPSENKTLPAGLEPISAYEVHAGDILMSRASGSPELVGSTALLGAVRERLMLSDKIFRIHVEGKISGSFFVWVMNSQFMRAQIEQALSGGNGLANNLPQASLLAFWLAVPPSHEQDVIVDYIAELSGRIDALISEGDFAVEILQERRAALISAAVTGKIDVRGWQPPASAKAPTLAAAEAH